MILRDVMDEIGKALEPIPGLHVYPWPADEISPPAAMVTYPSINIDAAFQRGLDRWTGGVLVLVERVFDRASRDQMSPFVSGDGGGSIIAALKAHDWQKCSYARPVGTADPEPLPVGGVIYLAYFFELDIAGPGTEET